MLFALFLKSLNFFLHQLNSKNNGPVLLINSIIWHWFFSRCLRGGSRGRVQGVRTSPPPWDYLQFSNTTGILQKKQKNNWFIGVEVKSKRRVHPLLKEILDPPLRTYPNFLKAVTVTSSIKAQTAIKVTNRVFQSRIHERQRKKNREGSYFSKTWKDVLWLL